MPYKTLCLLTALGLLFFYHLPQDMTPLLSKESAVKTTDFIAPRGDVLLKISGEFSQKNNAEELWLDASILAELPHKTIKTSTLWTQGDSEFKGPLLRDVLSAIGNQASLITAIASNEYKVQIPIEDVINYDVILAMAKDGKNLTIRDKGPLWIIYPWSSNKLLQNDEYYSRSIWQLVRIKLHD